METAPGSSDAPVPFGQADTIACEDSNMNLKHLMNDKHDKEIPVQPQRNTAPKHRGQAENDPGDNIAPVPPAQLLSQDDKKESKAVSSHPVMPAEYWNYRHAEDKR